MTVGITDVARTCGVSASTVSRALRGRPGVSEGVRAQITAVAAELGYTASRSASSLASGRTFTIGVVAPYIGRWFFGTVLDAAEQVFSDAGYDVLLYNLGSADIRKRFFTKLPVRKRVDAVLSLLIPDKEETTALRSLGVPLATTVHREAPVRLQGRVVFGPGIGEHVQVALPVVGAVQCSGSPALVIRPILRRPRFTRCRTARAHGLVDVLNRLPPPGTAHPDGPGLRERRRRFRHPVKKLEEVNSRSRSRRSAWRSVAAAESPNAPTP